MDSKHCNHSSVSVTRQEMQAHIDKINEMASVMRKAVEVDEGRLCEDEERIKQLEVQTIILLDDVMLCYCHVMCLVLLHRKAFTFYLNQDTTD
jgi:hypothetical protein